MNARRRASGPAVQQSGAMENAETKKEPLRLLFYLLYLLLRNLRICFSIAAPCLRIGNLERETRLELATSTLARLRSTN